MENLLDYFRKTLWILLALLLAVSSTPSALGQKNSKKDAVQKPDARAKEAAAETKKSKKDAAAKDAAEAPKADDPKPKPEVPCR